MDLKGLSGGIYKPLTPENIETVHNAALIILEKTGIKFEDGLDETIDLLDTNGATVDRDCGRFFLPRDLVMEQIRKAPEQVILYSRDGGNDLNLSEHRVYLGTGGAAINILDLHTGEARPSTLWDLYQLARLADALDHIHFFLRPCAPTDIPETAYDENSLFACLKGTAKHVMLGVTDEQGFQKVFDIASMIAGGTEKLKEKPFFSTVACFAISPLKLCTQSTLNMQAAVRHQIPVALSSAPMAGSTAPMTMAGTLAQLHAEEMCGITICQLTHPAAPILYGGIPGMANMATMGYVGGAVEFGMMNAAIHQMARHIKVPNYNSCGLTDSKVPDAQAGWEKAFTALLASMAGSNYVHHAAGMLESMLTVAYEQFVMDDEIIGMCCKVIKGIEVDAEHLALEVIDSQAPRGDYMTSNHTLEHLRKEYFIGNGVTDKRSRDQWENDGARDARVRAREIAKSVLAREEKSCIPKEIEKSIRAKFTILLRPP